MGHMVNPIAEARLNRGNLMLDAMKKETDRGKACVGDAMLDELFDELFRSRFIEHPAVVEEALGGGSRSGTMVRV
jgi:hypothetical protein